MNDVWRGRLREAIKRSGRKHSDVAWSACITPVSLSKILNRSTPKLQTIIRLAATLGVTVGWLLNEQEFRIGERERTQLRNAGHVILRLTGE